MSSQKIVMIAALDRDRVIGREGELPWRLPDDLARFKALTLGKPIVMGRKTYDSVGKPLPKRTNIVLTRSPITLEGSIVVHDVKSALDAAGDAPEVCIIGGGTIYELFMPIATDLELTHVETNVAGDARFPVVDPAKWTVTKRERHEADARHAFAFEYVTYARSGAGAQRAVDERR
jgi:dihydrofolate reductase